GARGRDRGGSTDSRRRDRRTELTRSARCSASGSARSSLHSLSCQPVLGDLASRPPPDIAMALDEPDQLAQGQEPGGMAGELGMAGEVEHPAEFVAAEELVAPDAVHALRALHGAVLPLRMKGVIRG